MGFVSKLFKAGRSVAVQSRREDRAQGMAAHKARKEYLKKHPSSTKPVQGTLVYTPKKTLFS